ncbi:hypothetical protein M885DRAFT_11042 [Pelagophyceae sp. CCMP2097]|nr:hypothetical protein M885DRAFT_11042 [Pelagophyceae sp. CCMP2097]
MVRLKVDGDGDLRQLPSKIDATTVLQALRSTTIPKNVDRKNIRKDSNVAVRSATFGALSRGNAPARVSEIARRRPILCELLARFGRSLLRDDFAFASIQLNVSYEAKMHVDASNDGPSAIIALGDFRGGELWTVASSRAAGCSKSSTATNRTAPSPSKATENATL